MFGFLFGSVCLVGFLWMAKCGHRRHHWWLRRVFVRLGTGPAQEKELIGTLEDFRLEVEQHLRALRESRHHLGKVLREPSFDTTLLSTMYAEQDEAIRGLRSALEKALSRTHNVLDDRQKQELARILESCFGHHHHCASPRWAPYRCA